MNDFTKEELIVLKNGIEYLPLHLNFSKKYIEKCKDIFDKLESMVDNYCEHEPDTMGISCSPGNKVLYTVHKCSKCKRFYFDDNQ